MKMRAYQTTTLTFLQNHWFKLAVVVIVLTAFAGKNMNVNFQMGTPAQEEKPILQEEPKAVRPLLHTPSEPVKKREKFTEDVPPVAQESIISKTGLLSVFGGDSAPTLAADAELVIAPEATIVEFVKRFEKVAITEMEKYNIPASITLAQSLLASQAGTSIIANQTNNYFNLECDNGWTEKTATYDGTCMRSYESAWFSFRNHSKHLSEGAFKALTNLDKTDYQRWAKGLELAGYSKDPLYAEKLIRIIEQYGLVR